MLTLDTKNQIEVLVRKIIPKVVSLPNCKKLVMSNGSAKLFYN